MLSGTILNRVNPEGGIEEKKKQWWGGRENDRSRNGGIKAGSVKSSKRLMKSGSMATLTPENSRTKQSGGFGNIGSGRDLFQAPMDNS